MIIELSFLFQHFFGLQNFTFHNKCILAKKNEDTDKFFLSFQARNHIKHALNLILKKAKQLNPQGKNLLHQGSIITHWRNEYGLMEAMIKVGHLHAKSTKRYEAKKQDARQVQLKNIHPMESIAF